MNEKCVVFGVELSTGNAFPLEVDQDGKIVLSSTGKVQADMYGWVSGVWYKSPLPFGFTDTVVESLSNTTLATGTNTLSGVVVPSGEVWVITQIRFRYVGTTTSVILVPTMLIDGTTESDLEDVQGVLSGKRYARSGWWVLKSGGRVRLYVLGATLNDDAYLSYSGFKMALSL